MSDPTAFTLAIANFAKKAGDNAQQVVRKIGIDILTRVVLRSPVDTGRFRANWQTGLAAAGNVSDLTDKSGGIAIADGTDEINRLPAGQSIYITNALPYARRLEYGWSKQAPAGMVRVTLSEYAQIVQEAVRTVK